ncbi:MAG: LysE family transporter [Rhodoferax sp.]|nr:LysE family transporter [Rhodoferax sp.]MBP7490993.1 LysE family transporter [Rhodoferax sp.]
MSFAPAPALAFAPAFNAGLLLSLSLIMALGPQNLHVIRTGLQGRHLWLTVGASIFSDALLIGLGVMGLAQLGGLSPWVKNGLIVGGIVFLVVYGAQAFGRFRAGTSARVATAVEGSAVLVSSRQALLTALAFAWLNPHAWLDTAVLIGAASMAWGHPDNLTFGLGAVAGSASWFVGLGLAVLWLGKRLRHPRVWRVLDGIVALMMWGTAVFLGLDLLGL